MIQPSVVRVVITGAGVVSAAGCSMPALAESLRQQKHCLRAISLFDAGGLVATHAGEVQDFSPLALLSPARVSTWDRGTQMAMDAAGQALRQAALAPELVALAGVVVGTSGSPQYQNLRVYPDRRPPASMLATLYMARSTPSFQADVLARTFGLGGVRLAFGSASLGGLLAISHAINLLRAGHAPAVLVGGGEIHTLMNALGMDTLGVAAAGPCTPFSGSGGMCFGEGAACFVLERLSDAVGRGAEPLVELVGTGVSADAYSDVAQDPSGRGLARAVRKSLAVDGTNPARIGWVRACGTGQRDLDTAETLGLGAVFGEAMPPLTSTEPYFGHVNGVSALLGLAAVVVAVRDDRAPCLPPAGTPRGGSAAPLLQPGRLPAGDCLLTATAFGGSNGAVVVRRIDWQAASGTGEACSEPTVAIVIAGMGAVSTFGGTLDALLDGVAARSGGLLAVGLARRERPGPAAGGVAFGGATGQVDDSWLTRKLSGVQLQRRTRLSRMVLLAVHEAIANAGVSLQKPERLGLLVGLTRGPLAAYQRFLDQTLQGTFDASTGRSLLRTGRFSVASEITNAFGLLGYSGAMACGVHGGVHVLAHGAEILRASPDLDGLLVVAADEWTELLDAQYRRLGLLRDSADDGGDPADGCAAGEGAAAILLRRTPAGDAGSGAAWARIESTAFAGDITTVPDPGGRAYSRAIRSAITRAVSTPERMAFAVGQGCGWAAHDQREQVAFRAVCPKTPLTSVLPQTGIAESAGGLFAAIAATAALGSMPNRRQAMVIGSTERGAHAAVVLSAMAA